MYFDPFAIQSAEGGKDHIVKKWQVPFFDTIYKSYFKLFLTFNKNTPANVMV